MDLHGTLAKVFFYNLLTYRGYKLVIVAMITVYGLVYIISWYFSNLTNMAQVWFIEMTYLPGTILVLSDSLFGGLIV